MVSALVESDLTRGFDALDRVRRDEPDIARQGGKGVGELARDALQPRQIAGAAVDRRPFFDLRQHRRVGGALDRVVRSEEHTSELQSLMRISYAVFCLKKKKKKT